MHLLRAPASGMHNTAVFFPPQLEQARFSMKGGVKEGKIKEHSTSVHVLFRSSSSRDSRALKKTGVERILVSVGVSRWLLIPIIDRATFIQLGMDPQQRTQLRILTQIVTTAHLLS